MEKNNDPLVSVVMANYNGERFVRESIESVLSQTMQDLELVIVDDASTDSSVSIFREYMRKDPRIRLIRSYKNRRTAASRNAAIRAARGEYVAIIDNDDLWEPDKLERQIAIARQGFPLVYSSYDFIDEQDRPVKRPFIVPEKAGYDAMLTSSLIGCSTAMLEARLAKEHPFRRDFYHEDYVLWMELFKEGIEARGDEKVLMHYRVRSGSRSNKKEKAAKERWKIYRKALHLSLPASIRAFAGYSIHGIIKYYL